MQELNNLNRNEAISLLKNLRTLQNLNKKLGSRWVDLFKRTINKKDFLKVEYFWEDSQLDFINKLANDVYKKSFWIDATNLEVIFVQNKELIWWMKVYYNDNVVDISFSNIINKIK